ncbi:hypothetical protein ACFSSA_02705 [Luteolibacter algae]|uniref:Type 4 fimbrial biogenesis protein PilX N-terminal domain-containing protein n=1 Tax=Luteolibacter algae TaxID=454151 RepID=A0ABW5D4E7_9BACT
MRNTKHKHGFALVVTLTLMVLLTIIALGLLSLSTIELRKQSKGNDMLIARANARLAAMLAINELQRLAGSDTQVTAPASLANSTSDSYPATGVWKSWEGTDRQDDGLPISPEYSTKFQKGDATVLPEDASSSDGRFLGWLVSGLDDTEIVRSRRSPESEQGLLGKNYACRPRQHAGPAFGRLPSENGIQE